MESEASHKGLHTALAMSPSEGWFWFCIAIMTAIVVLNQVRDWAEHAEIEPTPDPKVFKGVKR